MRKPWRPRHEGGLSIGHLSDHLQWRYIWQMEEIYVTFWKSEMTLRLTNGRNLCYLLKIWNDVTSDKWKEFMLPFENLKWRYVWQMEGIYVTFWKSEMTLRLTNGRNLCYFWKSEMTLRLTNGRNLSYLLKIWNDVMSDKWKEFKLPFENLKWRYVWQMEGIYVTFWKSEMLLCLTNGRHLLYLLKIWNDVMSDKWKEFTLPFENLKCFYVWQMEGIYVTFWKSEMTLCLTNGRNLRYLLKIWNDVMSDKWKEFMLPFENMKWCYVWQKGRNLCYLIVYNVIWANQKT